MIDRVEGSLRDELEDRSEPQTRTLVVVASVEELESSFRIDLDHLPASVGHTGKHARCATVDLLTRARPVAGVLSEELGFELGLLFVVSYSLRLRPGELRPLPRRFVAASPIPASNGRGRLKRMAAAVSLKVAPIPREQRMLLRNVTWKEYVLLREVLDGPGVRMTYLRGDLELMSPSPEHELWKKNVARFVELFAHLMRIDLYGYGSTTFKREAKERGAEPDECYLVNKRLVDFPEIVLEVIHTSPLLDKLDVYVGMGVREVWVFQDGAFTIHELDRAANAYVVRPASSLVPSLDFAAIARYAMRQDTPQALREFEAELGTK